MFASKSERKVHYSIRKFSIGVASVVVASLFLGGVVHAEEVRRGNNLTVTSSGDEVESHYQSILEKVRKSLEKDRHTQNVDLIKKLQDIKRTYLYNLKEKPEAELTSKTKKELDAAFEKFKKEPELTKKLAEAEKKAKDQKEEDHRNYPTNTYKTIELEIAEAEVGVAKAELELAQAQVQIPQDTEKINAAKAKVEAAKSNVKKLEKIKSDIEKTYLYKLDNSTKETPKPRVRRNSPEIKAKGRVKNYKEANIELSKYMTDLYKLDNSTKETPKSRVRRNSPQVGDSRELKETIDKAKLVPEVKPQPENPEPKPQPEGEKPSVPDINQEKEKAKLAIATYMSKILDDIKKHHLKKEKHHQIVALIKDLDKLKKQALSEIDNVNTKVEIENTVHKVFADMDTVVTKFQKGLIQNTPQVPEAPKSPEVPKVSDTPKAPDTPQVPEAPKSPEVPKVPDTPKAPDTPQVPEAPKSPEVPKVPDTPKAPDTPQVPEAPKAPDTPQIPEAPAPETPAPAPEAPKTGWKQENGMWYFYNTDGSMATGWLEYNGSWYYLNANGAMATGWLEYNGSW
ncbi:TPA: RICH domain-containing protein, partial [Streptococcus pneumoniae]|nr:RICH domain-containing protein [Streptococcus pneumoniae]